MPRTRSAVAYLVPSPLLYWPVRFTALILAGLLLFSVACSSDDKSSGAPQEAQPNVTGEKLASQFLALLQKKDVTGLRSFLSDAFVIQRADGSYSVKDQYLTNLPTINEFKVGDVRTTQSGDALVVHWQLTVNEVIDGRPFETAPAPRLSTFVWTDGQWTMTSHANFNIPAATPTPAR